MKILIGLIVGLVMAALLVVGINFYLTPQDDLANSDVIVAISGGDTEARTMRAVELYKDGYAPKVLFSGAALDPLSPSNAEAMKKVALDAGVHGRDIVIEEAAKNTAQNASNSQSLLESRDYKRIILVTSPYHQRRAYLEFQDKLGDDVEIINYSSEDKSWPDNWWLTPRGWWLGVSESFKTVLTAIKNLT